MTPISFSIITFFLVVAATAKSFGVDFPLNRDTMSQEEDDGL